MSVNTNQPVNIIDTQTDGNDLHLEPIDVRKSRWRPLEGLNTEKADKQTLGQILIHHIKALTEIQLQEALKVQKDEGGKLGRILIEKEFVKEEDMLKALAYQLDLPYYDKLPFNDIDPTLVESIQIQFCRDNKILPIARDEFYVTVAVADPLNIFPLDDLRLIMNDNINMIVSPPSVINNCINKVYERASDSSQKAMADLQDNEADDDEDLERTRDLLESADDEKPIIRFVNGILARAVKEQASDIHIEPYDTEVVVRFRIDGALQDRFQLPKKHVGTIATRIKIMGKLNIAEKRVPQDGRIARLIAGRNIDMRLSTLPTAFGERIVMRLLDKSSGTKNLDDMGLNPKVSKKFKSLIEQKHGIVLVTGPTGSGKTTLLYAAIVHIHTPEKNILTIEDPVEYQLDGIGQTEVKDKVGMTFGAGLRALLRQDPDVIMIGEIRDGETAQIAIKSSMTGHLVLSTVHTNDTASTVTRMMDFGVEPFKLASAMQGVIAARLIRRLCTSCRAEHVATDAELVMVGSMADQFKGKKIYRAGNGCEKCFSSGYAGRCGIHELLVFDPEIKELIVNTQDANVIKKMAIAKGMQTLRESALDKALLGITSIEEAISRTQNELDNE